MIGTVNTLASARPARGIEAVYAGVDWLSCSCAAERSGRWAWADECRRTIEDIAKEGYNLEAFTRNGYSGLGAGGSFCGSRLDGTYLQLSGHHADMYLDRVYRADLHISRIDIQATVRYLVMDAGVGQRAYGNAVDANGTITKSRQRRIWYMSASDGGYTCYIGAPTSEQRGKLYNKEVQSEKPEYVRCWRWEVTYKNDYATEWGNRVASQVTQRASYCARAVVGWFEGRGVPCKWWVEGALEALPLIKEAPSDADKRLKWLREQVRPAYHWLVANGYESEAIEALGIEESGSVTVSKPV